MFGRKVALVFVVGGLGAAGTSGAAAGGSEARPVSAAKLAQALASPALDPRRTGVLAVDLETGQVVYQRNASLALAPASAEKLAIAFAALRLLGPSYRFRTEVSGSGALSGRVWRGDLFLVGHGDPTLGRADLDALAAQVRTSGIRRVTGAVVGDERHFDNLRAVRGWKPSFLGNESRPLSALALADVPAASPNGSAASAASSFTVALERRGVAVLGRPRTARAPADILPLAVDFSQALARIVLEMNRESDNFLAEMLLKELGAALAGSGTSAAGAAVVRGALVDAGVPAAGVRIVDGSGLSLLDRLTARALVELLRAAELDPEIRDAFVASLPVAGVSGTLRDRLLKRVTRGKVLAKTGTTSRASALAGFVRGRYAFAILHNGSPVSYWSARLAQDRFVTVLARS